MTNQINGNLPAFPLRIGDVTYAVGLNKREYFAGLAVLGIISSGKHFSPEITVKKALECADELLKKLDEEQP